MALEVNFYQLQPGQPIEWALAKILEKAYSNDLRAVVYTPDAARMEVVDQYLWTYGQSAFLPHGRQGDGFADQQPIWITTQVDIPNCANLAVLLDTLDVEPWRTQPLARVAVMFDASDEDRLQDARRRRDALAAEGVAVKYWVQNAAGAWEALNAA